MALRGGAASAGMSVSMILDGGDVARVATIAFQCVTCVVLCFEFDGTAWQLTRFTNRAREWFAQPMSLPWFAD